MNQPIHDNQLNRILLKPRFKIRFQVDKEEIMQRFQKHLNDQNNTYLFKKVDHHIVIDVPREEEHFWSPQLHVEIEEEEGLTIVKGILGPKPKIWTFFMFLHFVVAVAFFVFFVIFYSNWSLDQDYGFALAMCILMPVVWIALYFAGQLGKKFGYDQMVGLHNLLLEVLKGYQPEAGS